MTIDDALDIADNEGLTPKENYVALTALAAEVRRYQAMRCETCKHKEDGLDECTKTRADEYGWFEDCSVFGGGCLAWEKRDE